VQIGNGGAAGTLGNVLVNNNSVLVFSRSDAGLVVANTISGSGSVVQLGPGMTTLTATNTFSGGTTVNGGTLSIARDANLGAVGPLTLNGGALSITASTTLNSGRAITLGPSGGTIDIPFSAAGSPSPDNPPTAGVIYYGVISGSGGLTINGGSGGNNAATAPYLLVLNAQNNYSGNTTINNATVTNDKNVNPALNILPPTTVLTLTNSAVFAYYNGHASQTLAGLNGDNTTAIGTENNNTLTTLTIDPSAGTSYTYAGLIGALDVLGRGNGGLSGGTLAVAFNGQGTQVLTGANDYTGGTTVNSGTLQLGNKSAMGTGGLTANGGVIDLHGFSPAVTYLRGAAGLITNTGTSNSTLTVNQGTATTFGGTVSDGPTHNTALVMSSGAGGNLMLSGTNTYTGGTYVVGSATLVAADSDAIDANGVGTNLYVGNDLAAFGTMVPLAVQSAALSSGRAAAMPEPGTLALLTAGAAAAAMAVRRARCIRRPCKQ
jgi:fibronectin-binding autotransporter adhesin